MERRVKERLIGAGIIVVIIVVFVPQLLSGPAKNAPPAAPVSLPKPASTGTPEPVRNVTVDLNNSAAAPAETGVGAPDAAASGAASTPSGEVPAAPSVPAVVSAPSSTVSQSARPLLESPASPPTIGGGWSVQLGSFASRNNADNLVSKVKGLGYSAYVAPQGAGRSERFRVRVGPAGDRAAAERMQARLRGQGHAGSLISPGTK